MAPQWGAWGEVGMASLLDDASKRRMNQSPMPPFTNVEGLYGLECGLRTGLPYFSVHKLNTHFMFGMIQGNDHPSQGYGQNFGAMVCPSAPSDPKQNPYTTLTYELRKNMDISDGLVFRHWHPKLAKQMER